MNALPLMAQAAAVLTDRLRAEPGSARLPVPPVGPFTTEPPAELLWDNVLLRSDRYRRAHVETLEIGDRLSVLHVCVFPHYHDPAPIFGFDMVAGLARVTGIFLDLSPVTAGSPVPRLRDVVGDDALARFAAPRALPEWGDIFSGDMLAVRPTCQEEVARAIALAETALDAALTHGRRPGDPAEIEAGQARYIAGQRRNTHTLRMLTGFIGPGPARRFIDEVLFPLEPPVTATP